MKLKNLNFFQKHVEKLAIAVAVLFSLGVLWFFVWNDPYKVEVDSQKKSPVEVEEAVHARARALKTRIGSDESDLDTNVKVPPYTDDFKKRLTRPALPVGQFTNVAGGYGIDPALLDKQPEIRQPQFIVPVPPAPVALRLREDFGVLGEVEAEPDERQQVMAAFVQLIGEQQPRDFRYITVGGEFDVKAWVQRLRGQAQTAPGAGRRLIPETWWQKNFRYVVDVILERQRVDLATGQWGAVEVVPPLPNQGLSFREPLERWLPREAERAVELIRIEQDRLARPPFAPLRTGMWFPPGAASELVDRHRLLQINARIDQLQRQLAQLRGEESGMDDPGLRPGAAPAGRGARGPAVQVREVERVETALRELMAQRNLLLGVTGATAMPEDDPMAMEPPMPMRRGGPQPGPVPQPDVPLEQQLEVMENVTVWAHDITVQPGAIYRYRLRVAVLNPLFQHSQLHPDQRAVYQHMLALTSEPTPWSAPVRVEPRFRFFLVGVNEQLRNATVETYFIFDGGRHVAPLQVRAGDPMKGQVDLSAGGMPAAVPIDLNAVAVDIDYESGARPGMRSRGRIMIFDHSAGRLVERTVDGDREDPSRERLRREVEQRAAGVALNR